MAYGYLCMVYALKRRLIKINNHDAFAARDFSPARRLQIGPESRWKHAHRHRRPRISRVSNHARCGSGATTPRIVDPARCGNDTIPPMAAPPQSLTQHPSGRPYRVRPCSSDVCKRRRLKSGFSPPCLARCLGGVRVGCEGVGYLEWNGRRCGTMHTP